LCIKHHIGCFAITARTGVDTCWAVDGFHLQHWHVDARAGKSSWQQRLDDEEKGFCWPMVAGRRLGHDGREEVRVWWWVVSEQRGRRWLKTRMMIRQEGGRLMLMFLQMIELENATAIEMPVRATSACCGA
jgi:hypothetical protein